jgi:hypothetical protein
MTAAETIFDIAQKFFSAYPFIKKQFHHFQIIRIFEILLLLLFKYRYILQIVKFINSVYSYRSFSVRWQR